MNKQLPWQAILSYGLLMPVAGLIALDFALGEASRGKGGFEAPWLLIVGLFVVPGLLVANCWLFFVRWSGRSRLFLAGLVLPALMGVAQVEIIYGPRDFDRWANTVLTASPWLLWVFLTLFFVPLLVLALRALLRRVR